MMHIFLGHLPDDSIYCSLFPFALNSLGYITCPVVSRIILIAWGDSMLMPLEISSAKKGARIKIYHYDKVTL